MTQAQTMSLRGAGVDERLTTLSRRVRSEYLEMPGLRLAPVQAARLLAIDPRLSQSILDGLVADGFLSRARDGSYLRTSVV